MRIIMHLDMDCFFAAVEERDHPELQGKPVIVGANPKGGHGRGVVSTANYVARKFGVKSGMPISEAYRRCPQAEFIHVRMGDYGRASRAVMEIVRELTNGAPFEQVSVDEAYVDISQVNSYAAAETLAREIQKEITKREQLTASFGVGESKLISKIAADFQKPNGCTVIPPEQAADFIAPMRANVLPGVGVKTAALLEKLGIRTVTDVRNIPEETLVARCGSYGEALAQLAWAIDDREVEMGRVVKSIGREVTFDADTRDKSIVMRTFVELCRDVHEQLRAERMRYRTVTVIYRFSNFETHDHAHSIPAPTDSLTTLKSVGFATLVPLLVGRRALRLVGVRVSQLTSTERLVAITGRSS